MAPLLRAARARLQGRAGGASRACSACFAKPRPSSAATKSGQARPAAPPPSFSRPPSPPRPMARARLAPASLPPLLEQLMAAVAVRPPYGQHPRLFIWGLIEARLQQADLIILGGLNEGVWPQLPTPDPWLAPQHPPRARSAKPRTADRPRRPRFRQRAGRARRCWSPAPAATPARPPSPRASGSGWRR